MGFEGGSGKEGGGAGARFRFLTRRKQVDSDRVRNRGGYYQLAKALSVPELVAIGIVDCLVNRYYYHLVVLNQDVIQSCCLVSILPCQLIDDWIRIKEERKKKVISTAVSAFVETGIFPLVCDFCPFCSLFEKGN